MNQATNIIALPTAARFAPPVCKRRGRYPAGVVSFAREKARRSQAAPEARLGRVPEAGPETKRRDTSVGIASQKTAAIHKALKASFDSLNIARLVAGLPLLPPIE